MSDVEQMFKISLGDEIRDVFYYQQVSDEKEKTIFAVPWCAALIRNCSNNGQLLEFKTVKEYENHVKDGGEKLWLYLPLKIFRSNDNLFAVFCCPQCETMAGTSSLSMNQDPLQIAARVCIHSKVCSTLIDWQAVWDIDISPEDNLVQNICNEDITTHTFMKASKDNPLLAGIRTSEGVAVLYTVTQRQVTPLCTQCVVRNCRHLVSYRNNEEVSNFMSTLPAAGGQLQQSQLRGDSVSQNVSRSGSQSVSNNGSLSRSNSGSQSGSINGSQSGSNNGSQNGSSFVNGERGKNKNYWEPLSVDKHQKLYGHNFEKITYPFKNDANLQGNWLERLRGNYNFPEVLIPEYKESTKCKHGSQFMSNDDNLYKESTNFILYSEICEKIFNIPVFARRTVGPCKCLQKVDGTKLLIWNLGNGRFVDFTLLHSYMHKWASSGIRIFALWKSIVNSALSTGISCTLQYDDLHRSITGFMNNIDMDWKKIFSCPDHGTSPHWIVADGKNTGPLKRRVDHLKELLPMENDAILQQSTKFKDRIFLSTKSERQNVCQMLTGNISMTDFAEITEMRSENGQMVIELVRHILQNFPDEMPKAYRNFLKNICSPASVRGLLQVLSAEPLQYLEQFSRQHLDLRSVAAQRQLKCVATNLPAVWPDLDQICTLENSVFLPRPVAVIVLKLLEIRSGTFSGATKRTNSDFVDWPNQDVEHPTQCYPGLPLWRFPSNYNVRGAAGSADLCDKAFPKHDKFAAGIFSIGCACANNITLGFELMLNHEGPKNLFRVLQCRDIDMHNLKGILVDHACLVDPYILNREAEMIEWKLLLVDGAHWNGMKKLKKPDRSGKNGHIGCSSGFNFNLYKPHLSPKPNSQGREQLHSLIEKCSDSLRLMSYRHFMKFMRIFFSLKNLENKSYR